MKLNQKRFHFKKGVLGETVNVTIHYSQEIWKGSDWLNEIEPEKISF